MIGRMRYPQIFINHSGTFILGFAFSYIFDWNVLTGLLATTPGGLMDTTLIAADFDSDIHVVAIMQLVRSVGVLLLFPAWINLFSTESSPDSTKENTVTTNQIPFLNKKHFLIVMLVGIAGGTVRLSFRFSSRNA
ncbi:AbrB family transcriptional regulator [Tetragenococcus muriaticus]|uniref:AbrB family transcriptional regulator n=1 Tax=Tetragenococcus muriaticus TaxID=64642 RepID=UPI0012DE15B9|nr:AbrB family transcriptional regulator [Tetragenococcus muriaticus]